MELRVDAEHALRFFASSDRSAVSERRAAAWDVGDRLREIIDRLVDTRASADDLTMVLAELDRVRNTLAQYEHGRRYESYSEASTAAVSDADPPAGHVDFSPLLGRANPLAPPMEFTIEGDKVCASVCFGHAYEGPPGHVHGGIVAAAFDELLGATQAMSGRPGMTGRLTVHYRAPTPLHVDLLFESTLDDVQGRKIFTSGRLFHGDRLCAEAEGLFITVDFAKIAAMRADRDGLEAGQPVSRTGEGDR